MRTQENQSTNRNEGEGSRTAAHHYEAGVKRTIASGKVDELAEEAKQELDSPRGEVLRRAEKAGKKPLQAPYKA